MPKNYGKDKLCFGDLCLWMSRREVHRGKQRLQLTTTEFNLLYLFLRHPRQVLTKEIILQHIWEYNITGSTNVIETYIGRLRKKLGKPLIIHTIRGAGYVLDFNR